ncbi:MAG: DUF2807 domain-containing protein [Bacteroidales bacterium]|nr:DUF2807 domain-containing protein [Bacteroidales bacterium]
MKRFIITLALATLALFTASAAEKNKTYDFGDITSISAGSNFKVYVTYGRSDKVKVVYDSDLEKYADLDIRYHAGRLSLNLKQDKPLKSWTSETNQVQVYLEMDEISLIEMSGAAKATFTGSFDTETLNLDVSGAASVHDLNITGQALDADISGAANATLTGSFPEKIDIDLSGAAKMSMNADSDILKADVSGAGKLLCSGRYNECYICCSGASNADISGKTVKAEYECSGASSVEAKELTARTVEVELTGASKATVYASDDLHYNVSRASKMVYYGNAKLHNHNEDTNIVKGR